MYKKYLFKSISFILMLLFLLFSCKKDNTDYSEIKAILDTVLETDKVHRRKIIEIVEKYGMNSKQIDSLGEVMKKADSINLIIVSNILDEYGWLGKDDVGRDGNSAIFLVIQHSDLETQLKYLPIMKNDAKRKDGSKMNLAFLEDRIALKLGKKQTYGTHYFIDTLTNHDFIPPLINPDKVDKWRKKVGLGTMQRQLNMFDLTWDIEEYKKQLPEIEKQYKEFLESINNN